MDVVTQYLNILQYASEKSTQYLKILQFKEILCFSTTSYMSMTS